MAADATEWTWNYSRSKNGARLVLLAIAYHGDATSIGVRTLVAMTGLSGRAVQQALQELVALGELAVDIRPGATNRYSILMPEREPLPLPLLPKPDPVPDATRFFVLRRDGYRCVRCGATDDLTIDHVYPRSLGGSHAADNLQALCRSCNSAKGARIKAQEVPF